MLFQIANNVKLKQICTYLQNYVGIHILSRNTLMQNLMIICDAKVDFLIIHTTASLSSEKTFITRSNNNFSPSYRIEIENDT